ncbi:MAG: AMP-binding protein [Bacilli bacterium]|nr:AMP-binding protein [Bacilli bacterium]
MSRALKSPWYKFYDDEQQHLDYPDFSVYKLIEYTASKHLNNIAYNYYGNKKTFHDFLKQIDDVARSFKALGVKPKDVISICMPNTPEAVIAFYAANKIGVVASMIHPLSAENEIKYFLNLSKTEYLICIDFTMSKVNAVIEDTKVKKVVTVSVAESFPIHIATVYNVLNSYNNLIDATKQIFNKKEKVLGWKEFVKLGSTYDKEVNDDFKGKDVAAILYSGGTTGTPKGVMLTNLNLNAQAMQAFEHVGCFREKDKILAIMPIFHGFGLAICVHTVLYAGGTCILLPQFNAKTFDKLMKKYEPNFLVGVPTLFEAILNNKKFNHMNLSYLHGVISGGDSLSYELKTKFDKWLKDHKAQTVIREGYGLTECGSASCFTPKNYYRPGSIGIPFPDMYYKIVQDGTEKEVPYGVEGEICIYGPTVMLGYIRNKKETRKALRKHKDGRVWLHTGDQGIMDKDGFVYFKSRIKRMIISSGYCVYPNNIENIIDTHKDVQTSCVIGVPHPYKVTAAKAFIVLKDPRKANEETLESIKKLVEKNLARYSWPFEYEFREELPKTLVGKIAYNVLIHEEEMKNKDRKWETKEEILEQVDNEENADELIEKIGKE